MLLIKTETYTYRRYIPAIPFACYYLDADSIATQIFAHSRRATLIAKHRSSRDYERVPVYFLWHETVLLITSHCIMHNVSRREVDKAYVS